MKIQVFGSGCPTCHKLFENTQKVSKELYPAAEVQYITDIGQMIQAGIMQSPALLIDGKIIFSGGLIDEKTIKKLITSFLDK